MRKSDKTLAARFHLVEWDLVLTCWRALASPFSEEAAEEDWNVNLLIISEKNEDRLPREHPLLGFTESF
jgi:hypothetical protein